MCWPHKRQCLQHLYIFSSTRKHSSLPGYPLHSVTNPTSVGDTASLPPCWGIPQYPSYNRFFLSPVPKKKMLHAAYGADLKNKNSRSGRIQSVPSPPVDGQSPSSFAVESSLLPAQFPPRKPRLHRSVARGGVYLRARTFRLSIAAPPLLPK